MRLFGVFIGAFFVLMAGPAIGVAGVKTIECDKEKDDQVAIQKAVDDSKAGDVIALIGSCDDVALVVSTSSIGIQGPADLNGNGSAPVIRVQDSGNVTLQDLDVGGGTVGIEVANGRVAAVRVDASDNVEDGFSTIQNAAIECTDCTASNNGNRGLLATGNATLCGTTELHDNGANGALAFLGGRIFSSAIICGAPPVINVSGSPSGLTLFQQGAVYIDEATVNITALAVAVNVFDSTLTVRRSTINLDDSGFAGLNIGNSATVRLNDDGLSLGIGSTSIQGNGTFGVVATNNSQVVLGNATVTGNAAIDVFVQDFGTANAFGANNIGLVSCEPGQSAGGLCP